MQVSDPGAPRLFATVELHLDYELRPAWPTIMQVEIARADALPGHGMLKDSRSTGPDPKKHWVDA